MKLTNRNLGILFAAAYMVVYTTPIFRFLLSGNLFRTIGIALLLLWLLCAFLQRPLTKVSGFIGLVLFNILLFILLSLTGLGNVGTIIAGYSAFWSFPIIFEFYRREEDSEALRTLAIILLVAICATAITTMYASLRYPNISKIKNTDSVTGLSGNALMYRLNAGGFDYIGGICVLAPMLIFLGIKRRIRKLLIAGIICTICTFISGYAIATLVLAAGLLFVVFSSRDGRIKSLDVIAIVISLGIIIFLFKNTNWLINLIGTWNAHLATRLVEIQLFLNGSLESNTDLGYRIELAIRSLNTFISHPLIGVGPYYFVGGHGLGNHSQILDDFGRFGLFGVIFYVITILEFSKWLKSVKISVRADYYETNPYLLFLFLSFLNPTLILPTLGMVLFFILPGLYYITDWHFSRRKVN